MNMMKFTREQKEKFLMKIHFKKKFFLKNFVIGFVILLIASMISMMSYDCCAAMCERMFGIDPSLYAFSYVLIFGMWKVLLVQFALVPFLAVMFMEKHIKAEE
jgi:hypothetical protein